MGYIRHNAIIVTSWKAEAIQAAHIEAIRIGLQVLGPSPENVNRYQSLFVCPDGSKEGWTESLLGDDKRQLFREYLNHQRYEDGSTNLEWVEVWFGSDDEGSGIVQDAWSNQITPIVAPTEER